MITLKKGILLFNTLCILSSFPLKTFASGKMNLLKISSFSLNYNNPEGLLQFQNFNLSSGDVLIKNKFTKLNLMRQTNHFVLFTENSEIIIQNFYNDLINKIDQLFIEDGKFLLIPGKKIYLQFNSAQLNQRKFPKLLFSCEINHNTEGNKEENKEENKDRNSENFLSFFLPCLDKGWLQIPKIQISKSFLYNKNNKNKNKKVSIIPSSWRNLKMMIKNNVFLATASSAVGLKGKLLVEGNVFLYPNKKNILIKINKAKFGILSIKNLIIKQIFKIFPQAKKQGDNISINL